MELSLMLAQQIKTSDDFAKIYFISYEIWNDQEAM